jgi:KAP family P-loop domain
MAVANPQADIPDASQPQDSETPATTAGSAPPAPETAQQAERPTEPWLYADKPLEPGNHDALGFGAYADALALLMDWKDTSTPLTIAINGPWGSGKTSLAKMAEARLPIGSDWDAPHVICWFDAWANDDAPHLGAAFAAAVAKTVNRQRPWWVRLAMPLPSAMLSPEQRWRRGLWLGVVAVVLAAAAVFWPAGGSLLAPFAHAGSTVSGLGHGAAAARLAWPLIVVAVIILAQRLAPSIQGMARWIDNPGSEAALGSMQDANRQLRRLIDQALRGKRRLMIFVDNLERCRPPRAVEVCEVVSQLIGHPEVVTVLIGDMDTIALSAEIKYAALESLSPGTTGTSGPGGTPGTVGRGPAGAYGRAYLEKLIQIQLRLPPPLLKDLRKMLVPVAGERPAFPPNTSKPEPSKPKRRSPARTVAASVLAHPWRWTFAALGVTSAIGAVGAALPPNSLAGKFPPAFAGVTFTVTVVFAIVGLWQALARFYVQRQKQRQKEETREALDKAVSSAVEPTETELRPEAIEELAQQVSNTDEREIRRRMRQRIISNNELRAELDHAVLEVLPPSPRAAKRMFNHAHLLLDIGVERGIFAAQPGLRARQLAQWVALTERWPAVAAAITGDPTLLERLEDAARDPAHQALRPEQLTAIETGVGITGLEPSLLEYLRRSDSLIACIRLLVSFSPYPDEEAAPDVAAPVTNTGGTARP